MRLYEDFMLAVLHTPPFLHDPSISLSFAIFFCCVSCWPCLSSLRQHDFHRQPTLARLSQRRTSKVPRTICTSQTSHVQICRYTIPSTTLLSCNHTHRHTHTQAHTTRIRTHTYTHTPTHTHSHNAQMRADRTQKRIHEQSPARDFPQRIHAVLHECVGLYCAGNKELKSVNELVV